MKSLLKNCAVTPILGYYAAGVTKRTSDIIDMAGYDGVMFIALLGTLLVGGGGTIDAYVEENSANTTVGMARLATTTVLTVTAAHALMAKSCIVVDVYQPQKQFLQFNVTPAVANQEILGVLAIQYKGRVAPVTQATNVIKTTMLTGPAEV